MQKNKKPGVNVIFLGGVDGIGMNMTAFEYENEIIAVDCGVAFPEDDMLGVDLVIPDFGYLEKNAEKLRALLITHGHEDHIGAVPFFLKKFDKVPVYATRLTLGIIEGKLAENGIKRADLREIRAGETVRLGSAFEAEYINVNHSMPDSCAICTNAERPGYTPSESSLAVSFDRIFNNEQRRIVIATFSSNVHRVQQIINAASKAGRKVAITGRSMQNFFSAAVKLGYLTVPDNIVIDLADVKKLPPSKVAVLTTGSQGEPMSALYRMAFGEHNMVTLGTDDLVVLSSSAIPGNEKLITKIINELYRRGAEVITYSNYDVHVSGHACREELKLMHALTAPEFFIPVHGEYKHLVAHAALAKDMGMPENRIMIPDTGEVIALSKRSLKRAGSVEAGSVMVDGSGIGDVSSIVLRERRRIAEEGVIFVSAGIDTGYMCISVMPEVTTRGFVYEKENADLVNKIAEVAYNSLIKTLSRDISDQSVIKSRLRDDIGDYARKRTGRKPTVVVLLSEVRQ